MAKQTNNQLETVIHYYQRTARKTENQIWSECNAAHFHVHLHTYRLTCTGKWK